MQDEHLTVDECDELAEALRQDAAALANGSECYPDLANIKRMVSQSELTKPAKPPPMAGRKQEVLQLRE